MALRAERPRAEKSKCPSTKFDLKVFYSAENVIFLYLFHWWTVKMTYGTFSSKANSYFRAYNRKCKEQTKEPSLINSWRYNTSITYILEYSCVLV